MPEQPRDLCPPQLRSDPKAALSSRSIAADCRSVVAASIPAVVGYAYDASSLARVTVELGDGPLDRGTVVVNPHQIGWWTVMDLPDH